MHIGVHRHTDVRMPHQVLQCLRIHARLCHIGTVGVSAYVWCDIGHLHSVNILVAFYHVVQSMLPMHRHFWVAILIKKQKSRMPLYHLLIFRFLSVLKDCLKAISHILCNRVIGNFLVPASVLVVSRMYFISEVLCN